LKCYFNVKESPFFFFFLLTDAKYGKCIPLINEPNNTESYCILYGYHSFDIDKLNISKSLKRKIGENLKQRNIGKLTKPCKTQTKY
jgi:hypothetical protein